MDKDTRATALLNTRNIWRWHIVNMPRRQSVAEHSYMVWVIGSLLYDQCCQGHNTIERTEFSEFLLTHDSEESVMGDMPSNVKEELNRIAPGVYDRVRDQLLGGSAIRTVHHGHWLYPLYKVADLTEAILFCLDNGAPVRVVEWLSIRLEDMIDDAKRDFPAFCRWDEVRVISNWVISHAES